MPITGSVKVTVPVGKEWKPVPEDIYQVVIKDIVEKDVKAYESDAIETKYLFKYVILDHQDDVVCYKQLLTDFAHPKWFSGDSKNKLSPSKLVTIFKSIYGFYFPDIKVEDIPADQVTEMVNQLIGSQVRVAVKVKEDESNKITDYLSVKEELEVPEDIKVAKEGFIEGLEREKKIEEMTDEEVKEVVSEDPAKKFEQSLKTQYTLFRKEDTMADEPTVETPTEETPPTDEGGEEKTEQCDII